MESGEKKINIAGILLKMRGRSAVQLKRDEI